MFQKKDLKVILASASPRRRELMSLAGYEFTVVPSDCDETLPDGVSPEDAVRLLAERKGNDVFAKTGDARALILSADTVVAADGEILGKPRDDDDARRMLAFLSGREHRVSTGVCIIYKGIRKVFAVTAAVEFYPLSDEEIDEYVSTGEPRDKAGAYGIQGKGGLLVKRIDGDFFTIVGLPVAAVDRAIRDIVAAAGD